MADNVGSKVTYFLVGLGVGALVGVLFAPKSGEETRDYLAQKADEGKDFAQRKARELRERADELIERFEQLLAVNPVLGQLSELIEPDRRQPRARPCARGQNWSFFCGSSPCRTAVAGHGGASALSVHRCEPR